MSYLLFMFAVLVIGTVILMGGIVWSNRSSEKGPYGVRDTAEESLLWGGSFFFSFGTEFLILAGII